VQLFLLRRSVAQNNPVERHRPDILPVVQIPNVCSHNLNNANSVPSAQQWFSPPEHEIRRHPWVNHKSDTYPAAQNHDECIHKHYTATLCYQNPTLLSSPLNIDTHLLCASKIKSPRGYSKVHCIKASL
jgi:hypothetical protein